MLHFENSTSFSSIGQAAALCLGLYWVTLAAYRLLFHPLAEFPGPKIAAISTWYEFYWDVIQEGRFTFHIQDLHKKYGPIVRIRPDEVHISDPDFYDELYSRSKPRDKPEYWTRRFGRGLSVFMTTDHKIHRMRRTPLNHMFSRQKIGSFELVIRGKLEELCQKLDAYRETGQPCPISRAYNAFSGDIITQYAFGQSANHLKSSGFETTFHESFEAACVSSNIVLHFPWMHKIMTSLPAWLAVKMEPRLHEFLIFQQTIFHVVARIRTDLASPGFKQPPHPTIFHELLQTADLPVEEKSDERLGTEAQNILAAGLETTALALTTGTFHIIKEPQVQANLVAELQGNVPDAWSPLSWSKLEALPYLTGCIRESIRLSYGISTRLPRLAPAEPMTYKDWVIPRSVAVSMTQVDMSHNENLFPDSWEFKPERWVGKSKERLEKYWVGFGKGTRSCLGQNLALAELYLCFACMFRRFRFTLFETDISDVRMKHDYLIPYPKWESQGVRVLVEKRP